MGDVNDGQGQNLGSPDPATPATPAVSPDISGQEAGGQGDGQGAGHQLNPEVTVAQQARATAEANAQALQAKLDAYEAAQSQQQPETVDAEERARQEAFDGYAQKSAVVKRQEDLANNLQTQMMVTQMAANPQAYPHFAAVKDKVIRGLKELGPIDAGNMDRAMSMVYGEHSSPLNAAMISAKDVRLAALEAENALLKGLPQVAGVDVGALQAQGGSSAGAAAPEEPGPGASAEAWEAYVDALRAQGGG